VCGGVGGGEGVLGFFVGARERRHADLRMAQPNVPASRQGFFRLLLTSRWRSMPRVMHIWCEACVLADRLCVGVWGLCSIVSLGIPSLRGW
jgi:hypothetical protein